MTRRARPPLPSADDVAAHAPSFDRAAVVIISGSLVAGFGHAYSDIDVYVVFDDGDDLAAAARSADAVPEPISGVTVSAFYVGKQRWDSELLTRADVEGILAQVERSGPIETIHVKPGEVELLYRISVGVAFRGHDTFDSWQSRIRQSRLAEYLRERSLTQASGLVEDALGLVEVGDAQSASYCVRLAFERMTDAFLFNSGRLCPNPKWRLAQLRQEPAGPITAEEYAEVVGLTGDDGERGVERIADRVRDLALDA